MLKVVEIKMKIKKKGGKNARVGFDRVGNDRGFTL